MNAWSSLVLGASILLALTGTMGAIAIRAPAPEPQGPTAYHGGSTNLTMWASQLQGHGFRVKAVISSLGLLGQARPQGNVLMVVAPRTMGSAEQAAIGGFLAKGGSVWLANNQATTNTWLAPQGIAIGDQGILDANALPPKVTLETRGPMGQGSHIVAFRPSNLVLAAPEAWTPWVVAPATTNLDLDGNGRIDRADPPGPHIVIAAHRTPQGGWLVVDSDSSMFSDGALQASQNGPVLLSIMETLAPPTATVFMDESQHGWTSPENMVVAEVQAGLKISQLPMVPTIVLGTILAALGTTFVFFSPRLVPYAQHERIDLEATPPSATVLSNGGKASKKTVPNPVIPFPHYGDDEV